MMRSRTSALAIALAVLTACSAAPQPIHLGAEECAHCRMVIDDPRFAGQLLNAQGRAYSFDAIECLAAAVAVGEPVARERIRALWVTDFGDADRWLEAGEAFFVHSPGVRSPMGTGLAAHASEAAARRHLDQVGGELLGWAEVVRVVGARGGAGHGHHHHPGG